MSISDLILAMMWFGAKITLYAFLTILIICIAITVIKKNKGIIRWYLKLKSSNAPEVDKIIDKIFEREKLFDEFTKIWSGYKKATIFLSFQLVFLYLGILWAIIIILSQSIPNNISNWSYVIYLIIFFLIFTFTIYYILSPMILKTFKKSEKVTEKSKLFLNSILVFITPILPYYILYYLLINKLENNWNTGVAVYLILTIGMYEIIKRILGFFLPTSPTGIYSTDELILQISLYLRGESNPLKEIVDQANDC